MSHAFKEYAHSVLTPDYKLKPFPHELLCVGLFGV